MKKTIANSAGNYPRLTRRNNREGMMKSATYFLILTCFFLSVAVQAQTAPAETNDSKQLGPYQVQQSSEFGYRFADVTGSNPMYSTLIDQSQGMRVLDQSLTMRSPQHTGLLFDDLAISSFGWGGDPENVARAHVSKFKDYDLTFLFRRDHNYFDYDLLANPLNPSTSTPSNPVNVSPNAMYNTRRMYDFDLTLMPQSKISIRLGSSHNRSDGPSYSGIHEGTDGLLYQDWNVTDNLYRFGLDAKLLPKTTISYDQFLDYGKNDTDYSLAPFATYPLSNGNPVELGLPWNTAAGAPCAIPLKNGVVNPTCSAYFEYIRNQRVRTHAPTEQLRVVSNYLQRVNLVGQGSYSNMDLSSPYYELFNGLARSGQRQNTYSGPANTKRVDANADLGLTVEITRSIQVSESFRYDNWHMPGTWDSIATSTIGVPVGTPPAVTLLSPLGATTTTDALAATFLGMRTFYSLLQVEYNPSRKIGARVGYKVNDRRIFDADPESIIAPASFVPFQGDTIGVNQQGPVFGVWMRPTDKLRVNIEAEALTTLGCQATCSNADQIFITRISPRQQQNYRGRASYKPVRWADLSGSVNWMEARNGEVDTQAAQHYRNAGAVFSLFPNDRLSIDLSYNYTDALQDAYICYTGTYLAPGMVVNGCPTYNATNATTIALNPNPDWIYSTYSENTHYFNGLVMFKPVKRFTANLGYGLTKTNGSTTILNPLQPLGPVDYTYYQPLGSLSYEMIKDWSVNAYWNYDQYSEGSFVGPTLPRYFHDNRTVLSLKYAF